MFVCERDAMYDTFKTTYTDIRVINESGWSRVMLDVMSTDAKEAMCHWRDNGWTAATRPEWQPLEWYVTTTGVIRDNYCSDDIIGATETGGVTTGVTISLMAKYTP